MHRSSDKTGSSLAYGVRSMPFAGNRFYEYVRYGLHVPGIFVGAPLNHCKICSTVSATAAMPLENKEELIISDGNSRINNRGLVRRSRRGLLERGGDGDGEGEVVVEESNGEIGGGAMPWQ